MNTCKNCNAPINEGETYCNDCQLKNARNAVMQYMQAMMRGDILTANRIKADNPNIKISSMGMEDSNGGSIRVCSNCGYKNKGNFLFLKSYFCTNCGNKI